MDGWVFDVVLIWMLYLFFVKTFYYIAYTILLLDYNLFDQNVTFYMKEQDIENIQYNR